IYSHDLKGNHISINKAGEQITGYSREEALTLNLAQTIAPESLPKAQEMLTRQLAGEKATAYEMEIIAKDGRRIAVEAKIKLVFQDGVPIGVQGVARDVTERKQLENQFRQAQKMESIGTLAGGIAHDFNNLLTVILSYSSSLSEELPKDSRHQRAAEQVHVAAERGAALTSQMLAFSRKQVFQLRVVNLNDIIRNLLKMLQRIIGEHIEIKMALAENLAPV